MNTVTQLHIVGIVVSIIGIVMIVLSALIERREKELAKMVKEIDEIENEIPTLLANIHAKVTFGNITYAFYDAIKSLKKLRISREILGEMAKGSTLKSALVKVTKKFYDSVLVQLLMSAYLVGEQGDLGVREIIATLVATGNRLTEFKNEIMIYVNDISRNINLILYLILPSSLFFVMLTQYINNQIHSSMLSSMGQGFGIGSINSILSNKTPVTFGMLITIKTLEVLALSLVFATIQTMLKSGRLDWFTFKVKAMRAAGASLLLYGLVSMAIASLSSMLG